MANYEKTGVFTHVDEEAGDTYELYPQTKAELVEGLSLFGPVATAGDGAAYTATVAGITALTVGIKLTIVPHTVSTTLTPTLDVNGLGAKYIRMPGTYNTGTAANAPVESFLVANKPVTVTWDGTQWETDVQRPAANSISGTVAIANGGTGATDAATARTNLGISATNTPYTNTSSGLSATTAQAAVDELASEKQNNLVLTNKTGSTLSVVKSTTKTLCSQSLPKGKYLILGSATIATGNEDNGVGMKICISTSTSFNNSVSGGATSGLAFAAALNCWGIFDLTATTTVYLLGYHGCAAARDATQIRLTAIKLA